MKKLVRLTVVLWLLLGILVGCGSSTAPTPEITDERWEETDCRFDVPKNATVGEDLICGNVTVPEQHAYSEGPTIRLAVAIIKSNGDAPAPDPFVMFTGGPGGNIFAMGPMVLSGGDNPIRAERDIVLMSERGTYGAEPFLDCPELAIVDEHFGAPFEELNALKLEAYTACRERLVSEGVNLNAYNNIERTADVPLVMDILGYENYNLWGVSGGGMLTQLVVRDYPEGVRTIMSDSGAFPTAHMSEVMAPLLTNISASYRLLFETCAADPDCNGQYPDLEGVFFDLVADLNANPVPVSIENPATGEETEIMLTGDLIIQTFGNLFSLVDYLPDAIYDTANGDYEFISGVLPDAFAGDTGIDTADGLYQSVFCPEVDYMTIDDIDTEGAYHEIVQASMPFVQLTLDICSVWDVESIPPGEVIVSDVPILIMEGAYDSNKPPELGAEVARNFSTSYLVTFGNKGHVTLGSCGVTMMAEFMNDPSQSPDTSCVADALSFGPPSIFAIALDAANANLPLVILGVAVLVAVIGGIIWLIRRRKAKQPA